MNREIAGLRLRSQTILAPQAADPAEVVARLGAVQAQDYRAALWAIALRTPDATADDVEAAVAEARIIRTWPLRGTLHFVHAADLRWMIRLTAPRLIAASARRFRELELDDRVVARAMDRFATALEGGRRLTRSELYGHLEEAGISTAGQRGYHLLWRAAHERLICAGPHEGNQQTFVLVDEWVPRPDDDTPRDEALARLSVRYFSGHGPATVRDFAWWTGLPMKDARASIELARDDLTRLTIDEEEYWTSHDYPADLPFPGPSASFLPPFDEYLVGYRNRDAVLDPAYAKAVNATGGMIAGCVIIDGFVRGTWKRTIAKTALRLAVRPFSALPPELSDQLARPAQRYADFLQLPLQLEFPS